MKALALAALSLALLGRLEADLPESSQILGAEDVPIHVEAMGQGSPLLFVPGWTMTSLIWREQMEALSGSFRVLAMDPRGQGESGKPPHGYDSRRRASDIHEVLRQKNLQRCVLIGWSLGAIDVVNYLNRFGAERLRAVVLIDNSVDRNYSSGISDRALLEELKTKPYPDFISLFIRSLFLHPPSEERLAQLRGESMKTPPAVAREAIAKASSGAGLAAGLRSTGLPAFYMVTPHLRSEALALQEALGPVLDVDVFENSGHSIFLEDPLRFRNDLLAFLSKHP